MWIFLSVAYAGYAYLIMFDIIMYNVYNILHHYNL